MKRKIFVVFTIILLMSVTLASAAIIPEFKIMLGDKDVTEDCTYLLKDNRTYIQLRDFCDIFKVPITWDKETNEVCIDIYNKKIEVSDKTEFKPEGVIPDEETAYTIGKVILEKYAGGAVEYETDERIYYLSTRYIEEDNTWLVLQTFDRKNTNGASGIDWADWMYVKLSKATGEVLYLNTASTFGGIQ